MNSLKVLTARDQFFAVVASLLVSTTLLLTAAGPVQALDFQREPAPVVRPVA